ncbi:MAG: hypothetical protein ACR2FG_10790 [Marmoricola sp.]
MTDGPDWSEVDAWLDPLAGAVTPEHLALVDSYRPPEPGRDTLPPVRAYTAPWTVSAYRHEPGIKPGINASTEQAAG